MIAYFEFAIQFLPRQLEVTTEIDLISHRPAAPSQGLKAEINGDTSLDF